MKSEEEEIGILTGLGIWLQTFAINYRNYTAEHDECFHFDSKQLLYGILVKFLPSGYFE